MLLYIMYILYRGNRLKSMASTKIRRKDIVCLILISFSPNILESSTLLIYIRTSTKVFCTYKFIDGPSCTGIILFREYILQASFAYSCAMFRCFCGFGIHATEGRIYLEATSFSSLTLFYPPEPLFIH